MQVERVFDTFCGVAPSSPSPTQSVPAQTTGHSFILGHTTNPDESVTETHAHLCPNGHPLRPPNVLVGFHPCYCAQPISHGHRTLACRTCGETMYSPPHDETLDG